VLPPFPSITPGVPGFLTLRKGKKAAAHRTMMQSARDAAEARLLVGLTVWV
jgi:hypothetical protein